MEEKEKTVPIYAYPFDENGVTTLEISSAHTGKGVDEWSKRRLTFAVKVNNQTGEVERGRVFALGEDQPISVMDMSAEDSSAFAEICGVPLHESIKVASDFAAEYYTKAVRLGRETGATTELALAKLHG